LVWQMVDASERWLGKFWGALGTVSQ